MSAICRYLVLDVVDSPYHNIIATLPLFIKFVNECLTSGGMIRHRQTYTDWDS